MKELEAIIEKWRKLGDNLESANRVLEQQWPRQCADELEALLPALEKAFIDLESEVSRYRGNYRGAQTEIAALRETMACTHPKACWKERDSKLSKGPMGTEYREGYCTACAHERLKVDRQWRDAKIDPPPDSLGYVLARIDAEKAHEWGCLSEENRKFYEDNLSREVDMMNTIFVRHWARNTDWLTHWMPMPQFAAKVKT